jgi:hypothetical protein
MQCTYVPTDKLSYDDFADIWLKILPLVRKLVARGGGRVTELSLMEECRKGEAQLWVSFDDTDNQIIAFIATKIRQYPKKRLLSFEYIGGEKLEEWFETAHNTICSWAQLPEESGGPGCVGVEAIGRLGWQRYLRPRGWTQEFSIYERMF